MSDFEKFGFSSLEPEERPPTRRWRVVVIAAVVFIAVVIAAMYAAALFGGNQPPAANPTQVVQKTTAPANPAMPSLADRRAQREKEAAAAPTAVTKSASKEAQSSGGSIFVISGLLSLLSGLLWLLDRILGLIITVALLFVLLIIVTAVVSKRLTLATATRLYVRWVVVAVRWVFGRFRFSNTDDDDYLDDRRPHVHPRL